MDEENLSIDNSNPEFFREVIETLPVRPVYFHLVMEIPELRKFKEQKKWEEYLRKCDELNVAYESELVIEVEKDNKRIDSIRVDPAHIISGRKIQRIVINSASDPFSSYKGYSRNNLTACATIQGYQFTRGDIWLATYSLGGGERDADSFVRFGTTTNPGLEVYLGSRIKAEDKEQVKKWFKRLDLRYHPTQQSLIIPA